MLRRSGCLLENFREHYHRIHLPRRVALQRHIRREERKLASRRQQSSPTHPTSSNGTSGTSSEGSGATTVVPYKYNRWWVNNDHAFVHQYAVVEDPDVVRQRRLALPSATSENTWKEPHSPFFLPFAPFVKVLDYPKDPDVKFLKPTNVPRWKDYMRRAKPVVPRTWY